MLYVLLSALLHKHLIFCLWNICSVYALHDSFQIWVCVATESNWRWRRVSMTPTTLYWIENETFKNKMRPQNRLSVYLFLLSWFWGSLWLCIYTVSDDNFFLYLLEYLLPFFVYVSQSFSLFSFDYKLNYTTEKACLPYVLFFSVFYLHFCKFTYSSSFSFLSGRRIPSTSHSSHGSKEITPTITSFQLIK